ncbi:hypothetical protein JCM6882_005998 [Rhodosporidiobolus microsporus]
MTAAVEPPQDQAAALHSILTTLDRTRASLPSLLASSLSGPSSTPDDRAQAYRTASHECWASIKALAEQLDAIEPVLQAAEASEAADARGVVVKPRERKVENAWEQLGAILSDKGGVAAGAGGKGKAKAPFQPQFDPPSEPEELEDLVRKWEEAHPRVRVHVVGAEDGKEASELRVTVRGVLRAVVVLRWEDREDGLGREVGVDLVSCYSLKEEKPPHLPSQYSLFQSLTNSAMLSIDRSRTRRAREGGGEYAVEEVLAFLSDPPLPF